MKHPKTATLNPAPFDILQIETMEDLDEVLLWYYDNHNTHDELGQYDLFNDWFVREVMDLNIGDTFLWNDVPHEVVDNRNFSHNIVVENLDMHRTEPYREYSIDSETELFLDWIIGDALPAKPTTEWTIETPAVSKANQ